LSGFCQGCGGFWRSRLRRGLACERIYARRLNTGRFVRGCGAGHVLSVGRHEFFFRRGWRFRLRLRGEVFQRGHITHRRLGRLAWLRGGTIGRQLPADRRLAHHSRRAIAFRNGCFVRRQRQRGVWHVGVRQRRALWGRLIYWRGLVRRGRHFILRNLLLGLVTWIGVWGGMLFWAGHEVSSFARVSLTRIITPHAARRNVAQKSPFAKKGLSDGLRGDLSALPTHPGR